MAKKQTPQKAVGQKKSTTKKTSPIDDSLKREFVETLMRFKRMRGLFNRSVDLNISEMHILHSIEYGLGISNNDSYTTLLVEQLHISKAAISQNLHSLEIKGLIVRSVDETDRRRWNYELTKEGQKLSKLLQNQADTQVEDLIERLGEQDTRKFLKIFDEVIEYFDEVLENDIKERRHSYYSMASLNAKSPRGARRHD